MKETFKQRIQKGEPVLILMATIDLSRSQLEDALANGSYDAVYIDAQHRAFSEERLVEFCAITEELGMPTQMRIPHTRHTYLVGRYCDLGLSSVLVPEVMEDASVHEAIEYFYYGTLGRRSWGGPERAGLQLFDDPVERLEYAAWWNDFGVLALQFESVEAVANARKLADRPGIDFVAFGPNDLQFSIERHSNFPLQTAAECFRNVAEQLDEVGIPRGLVIATKPEERDYYRELGITIFWEAAKLSK
ncbi:MAG: aldolase/citrate lyase family protein [bacterium]|nr:aldolase/citrate lyase family protein [bacterium]